LRRVGRRILPRSAASRAARALASLQRRTQARHLDTAPEAFEKAYASYWRTGEVPDDAGDLLFLATWASGGTLPRDAAVRRGHPFDPTMLTAFRDDLLAPLDATAVAERLEAHGCYIAPFTISLDAVDEIRDVVNRGPARPRGDGLGVQPAGRPHPGAPTWWVDNRDALASHAARRLLVERRMVEAAGTYLGLDPLVMSVVLWKSYAWRTPDRRSAQQFHYDNDRASFVKMFVYLTDVDTANGPHTYVRRSHRAKPIALLDGRRLTDEEVARHYPRETWEVITGPRGTLFFADTQGFHKGGHIVEGHRSIFQINLASDRFGVPEPAAGSIDDAPGDLSAIVRTSPRYFSQLLDCGFDSP
jgi:hypothetical protein